MKTLTADTANNFIENTPAELATVQSLLDNMIDDNFVILDDSTTQSYIQTTPDDKDGFVVEVRYYFSDDERDFKHYRKICDDISAVFDYFEQFFNGKPININDWQNITQDFEDRIYIKRKTNQKEYEYYLMLRDDTHENIIKQIRHLDDKHDFLTIYFNDENSEPSLTIRPQHHDYELTLNHHGRTSQKLINNIDHLITIIINFLNNDMSDWVN